MILIARDPAVAESGRPSGPVAPSRRAGSVRWLARTRSILTMVPALAIAACTPEPAWEFSVDSAIEIADSLKNTDPRVALTNTPDACLSIPDSGSVAAPTGISQYVARYLARDSLGFECATRVVTDATERSGIVSIDEATELVAWRHGRDSTAGTVFVGLFYEQQHDDTFDVQASWPLVVGLEGLRSILESADTMAIADVVLTVSDISMQSARDPSFQTESDSINQHAPYSTHQNMRADHGPVLPTMSASAPGWVVRSSTDRIGHGGTLPFARDEAPKSAAMATHDTATSSGASVSHSPAPWPIVAIDFRRLDAATDSALLEEHGTELVEILGPAVQAPTSPASRKWDWPLTLETIEALMPLLILVIALRLVLGPLKHRHNHIQQNIRAAKPPKANVGGLKASSFNFSSSKETIRQWNTRITHQQSQVSVLKTSLTSAIAEATEPRTPDDILGDLKYLRNLAVGSVIKQSMFKAVVRTRKTCLLISRKYAWIARVGVWIRRKFLSMVSVSLGEQTKSVAEQRLEIFASISQLQEDVKKYNKAAEGFDTLFGDRGIESELHRLELSTKDIHESLAATDGLANEVKDRRKRAKSSLLHFVHHHAKDEGKGELKRDHTKDSPTTTHNNVEGIRGLLPSNVNGQVERANKATDRLTKLLGNRARQTLDNLREWRQGRAGLEDLAEATRRLRRTAWLGETKKWEVKIDAVRTRLQDASGEARDEANHLAIAEESMEELRATLPNDDEEEHLEGLPGSIRDAKREVDRAVECLEAQFKYACKQAFLKMRKRELQAAMEENRQEMLKGTVQRIIEVHSNKAALGAVTVGVLLTLALMVASVQHTSPWPNLPGVLATLGVTTSAWVLGGMLLYAWVKLWERDWLTRQEWDLDERLLRISVRRALALWFWGGCGVAAYGVLKGLERVGSAALAERIAFDVPVGMFSIFATALAACSVRDGVGIEPRRRLKQYCEKCNDEIERDTWQSCDMCEVCECNDCVICRENEITRSNLRSRTQMLLGWGILATCYMGAVVLFGREGWFEPVLAGVGQGGVQLITVATTGVLLIPLWPLIGRQLLGGNGRKVDRWIMGGE